MGGRFLGVYGLRNEVDCIEDFAFYMGGVTGYHNVAALPGLSILPSVFPNPFNSALVFFALRKLPDIVLHGLHLLPHECLI